MRLAHRVFITGVMISLLSCSDTTAPVYLDPCDGVVQVSVASESNGIPVISWSPSCGMSRVAVSTVAANPSDERPLWVFSVPENAAVGPGVVYGMAPDRATVWHAIQPLVPGTTYRVRVNQTLGEDVVVAGGETTFTR